MTRPTPNPKTLIAVLLLSLLIQPVLVPGAVVPQGKPLSHSPTFPLPHSLVASSGKPAPISTKSHNDTDDRSRQAQLREIYGKLPLSFERNQGQVDGKVKFLSRGNGYTMFLTATEAVLALSAPSPKTKDRRPDPTKRRARPTKSTVLRMKLVGANPSAEVAGLEQLPGKSNYFIGSEPAKWRTNVATFARVKYREVYPGIDLVYYGNQRQLEYDWIVSPGADPDVIKFAVEAAKKTKIDSNGDLVLTTTRGEVRLQKPVVYQETAGVRHEIAGAFAPRNKLEIGFTIADYDRARPLVIDPVLAYSTYHGGTSGEIGSGIAVDFSGNAYVTGTTWSNNFPTASALQPTSDLSADVFVTKFNSSGSALIYSTYLGGSYNDYGNAIAVDPSGKAYVTGTTYGSFPTANPFDPTHGGTRFGDAFVTKLNSSGSALVYSTYLGGYYHDDGEAIAVDSSGNAYVTGTTKSNNFPTANPFQPTHGAGDQSVYWTDAFVTKFSPSGNTLVYSTYLGGAYDDEGHDIAVDSSGSAYVTGYTSSRNFPTANPLQPAQSWYGNDAFVTKFNSSGSALVYSTYLGGIYDDRGHSIAVDYWGNAYVTGETWSADFPTANPLQPSHGGGSYDSDAFVTKFNSSGSALVYSTFLGGTNNDYGFGIAVDSPGYAYVTGYTDSSNFPTANPVQPASASARDAFVTMFNPSGSTLHYSTYLGGGGEDRGMAIAVDSSGNAYVAGYTFSTNFPTANPLQPALADVCDAFVSKIQLTSITVSPTTVSPGGSVTATWASIRSPTTRDWIGLYATPEAADDDYISSRVTNGQGSSSVAFTIPAGTPPGTTYELRLFNFVKRLAISNSFTVQPTTLRVSPLTVNPGFPVTATWVGIQSPSASDWIGLYASSTASHGASLRYQFTNGQASGSAPFTVPAGTTAGTTYELRLFGNGTYTSLATSDKFTIQIPTLSVSPTTVSAGGSVTATWANIANPSASDWIGLYSSSGAGNIDFIAQRYTNGQASGNVPFTIPADTAAGTTYELRLFSSSYTRLATSNSFTIPPPSLSVSPTTGLAGGTVTATWANIGSPAATNWLALYTSSGAPNSSIVAWRYTNGLASGSVPFTIPVGTAPGTLYELRLFADGSYTRLATSNRFTIWGVLTY